MTVMTKQEQIRNVAIIAHINHGKSTLADRLLEKTGTIPPLKMRAQVLDNMELERERGVTIKLKAVRMKYRLPEELKRTLNFEFCTLNLIDTPGHVDFGYEVSRSLAACEGALLVVDASAGVQAQTYAHGKKAQELGLKIIPIVNKIDLAAAEPKRVAQELVGTFGFDEDEILFASAKEAIGIKDILNACVERIPHPTGVEELPLRGLIFDSSYDEHKGVLAYIRVVDGKINKTNKSALRSQVKFIKSNKPDLLSPGEFITNLKFLASGKEFTPKEIGVFTPARYATSSLSAGEVGYIATGLKDVSLVKIGDTVTNVETQTSSIQALPGYQEPKPVVFVSFYPLDNRDFPELEQALKKLKLTDPAVSFEREGSSLGQGFRCGFLGLFHAEIVQERIERDFGVTVFATNPSIEYEHRGKMIKKPADLPQTVVEVLEPWTKVTIFTPKEYLGSVMQLCADKRGKYLSTKYFSAKRVELTYEIPLSELITNFFDRLKSLSSGFASLDYEIIEYRPVEVARLDVLVAGDKVDALSQIVRREDAAGVGRLIVKKLKEVVPKQQFAVALQAAIGGKIVARETIPALRKDVTAKLYGGDVTRKKKLLEKQKAGKKRLKKMGRVAIPQEAFFAVPLP
jgi:GTP-binding protein LepA